MGLREIQGEEETARTLVLKSEGSVCATMHALMSSEQWGNVSNE